MTRGVRRPRNSELLAEMGKAFRRAREAAGLKAVELAAAAGYDSSMVTHVERGRGGSLTTLYALARALRVRIHDLLPEDPVDA